MADFTTLMNMIENTIEPDSWLSAGGTSVMLPYPAGVWVDPKGKLARKSVDLIDDNRLEKLLGENRGDSTDSTNHAWHKVSPLRMVSLKQLDQLLFEISSKQAAMRPELVRIAGLNCVQYVLVDMAREDIILAGPADGNQNGFFLEDLAVVTGLISQKTGAFGCTIEPVHDNLLRSHQFVSSEKSRELLSQSPAKFTHRLRQLMGSHQASVFGMREKTSTAIALLAADVQMKELGFGKSDLPLQLPCYFDFLERETRIPIQSLIRWWFDYSNQPVASNQMQSLFRLPSACVQLFSEQQFMSQNVRQASGQIDPAADAFAAQWNRHMPELRACDSNFSRMCCVFELALALQLSLESTGLGDCRAWFPTLSGLGCLEQDIVNAPKWVDGLVVSHQLKRSRTNIAVVSGGVRINPMQMAARANWQESPLLSGSKVPQMPQENPQAHWWWD